MLAIQVEKFEKDEVPKERGKKKERMRYEKEIPKESSEIDEQEKIEIENYLNQGK
jgi:hypothetical protein